MKEVVDFKGIKYNSINQMCKAYNIDPCTFNERLRRGYNLEKALTFPITSPSKSIVDFEGNRFDSITNMCKYYNISVVTYRARLRSGWDLKKILTTPIGYNYITATDFNGNKYRSVAYMCSHFGIPRKSYIYRINNGWSQKEALTIPVGCKPPINERLSNVVKQTYNVNSEEFQERKYLSVVILNPQTQEKIQVITDYKGNVFSSKSKLLKHYDVYDKWFDNKLVKEGLKAALTRKQIKDHLGNVYSSKTAMYKAYGLKKQTAEFRLERGWTLEQTLTTPVNQKPKRVPNYVTIVK